MSQASSKVRPVRPWFVPAKGRTLGKRFVPSSPPYGDEDEPPVRRTKTGGGVRPSKGRTFLPDPGTEKENKLTHILALDTYLEALHANRSTPSRSTT